MAKRISFLLVILFSVVFFHCAKVEDAIGKGEEEVARGTVTGTITDPDGNPIEGVTVTVVGDDSAVAGISDADGKFTISQVLAGEHTLRFVHPAWDSPREITVTVLEGQEFKVENDIILEAQLYEISGVLIDANGDPIPNVIVTISDDTTSVPGISNADGKFTVSAVPKGDHTLVFIHPDWLAPKTVEVSLTSGVKNVSLDNSVTLESAFYSVKGTVQGGQSQAIAGAGVAVARTNIMGLSDENGEFLINRIPKALGNFTILAARSDIGFSSQAVTTGTDDVIDIGNITLKQGGINISGRVLDPLGIPVSGALVQAVGPGIQDTTDELGQYLLKSVPSDEDGVRITVPEMEKRQLVGAVMGFKATGSISGMDIYLKTIPAWENDMRLVTTDLVVKETATTIDLSVFPETRNDAVITGYEWSIPGGDLLNKTIGPNLSIDVSDLNAAAAAKRSAVSAATTVRIEVTAVNSDSALSEPTTFVVSFITDEPEFVSVGATSSTDTVPTDNVTIFVNERVTFTAVAFDPFGGIREIQLDAGDSTPVVTVRADSSLKVRHIYTEVGTYTAILKVIDTDDNEISREITVNVELSEIDAPVLLSPSEGFIVDSDNGEVTFEWQGIGDPKARYALLLDAFNDPPFNRVEEGLTGTKVTVTLDSGVSYLWRVEASVGTKVSYSETWSVFGKTNIEYLDFLLLPSKDSVLTGWDVEYVWKNFPKAKYKLFSGLSYTALTAEGDGYNNTYYAYSDENIDDGRTYYKSGLQGNTRYFWRVIMKDSSSAEHYSPVWTFMTPNHLPSRPTPSKPANGIIIATGTPITFEWTGSDDADENDALTYLLFLGKQDPPNTLLAEVSDTTVFTDTAGVLQTGTYFWRVGAWDGHDTVFQPNSWNTYSFQANNAPVFVQKPEDMPDTLSVGDTFTDTLEATDADGDNLSFYELSALADLSVNWSTGILTFSPTFSGDTVISIYVEDENGSRDTLSWRIRIKAPNSDILMSPAPDSLLEDWSIYLIWKYIPNAEYRVFLGESEAGLTAETNWDAYYYAYSGIPGSRYHNLTGLTGNTTYFWQIRMRLNGNIIQSPVWTFRTPNHVPVPAAPSAPTYNKRIMANQPIPFSWTGGTDTDGDDQLTFSIFANIEQSIPTTLLGSVTDTNKYIHAAGIGTEGIYRWRVSVFDGHDTAVHTQSTAHSFTIVKVAASGIQASPGADTILAGLGSNAFNFTWNSFTGMSFQLWLGRDSASLDSSGAYTTYAYRNNVPINEYGVYWWQVYVKDEVGNIKKSPKRRFTHQAPDLSGVLGNPADGDSLNGGSNRFYWNQVPWYSQNLQIGEGDTANLDSIYIYNTGHYNYTGQTYRDYTLKGNRVYFWRVVYEDAAGARFYSPTRVLYTRNQKPSIPGGLVDNDIGGLILTNTLVNLSWNASTDADGDSLDYIIQLDSNTNAPRAFLQKVSGTTHSIPAGLAATSIYYWRVGAYDGIDTTWSSSVPYFYTNGAPSLDTPTDTSVGIYYTYSINLSATDSYAGTNFSYYKYGATPAGLTISAAGAVSWTPALADIGTHTIYAYVRDSHPIYNGAANRLDDSVSWTITVNSSGSWQASSVRSLNGADSDIPQIAYNGSTGYVALRTGGTGAVSVWSTTNDFDWNKLGNTDPTGATSRNNTGLAVNGTDIYLLYQEYDSPYEVMVMHWNGAVWDTLGNDTVANGYSGGNQSITIHLDTVYVGYVSNVSPYQGYVKKFNGTTWELVANNFSTARTDIVRLASDGTDLFVAYRLYTDQSFSVKRLTSPTWTTVNPATLVGLPTIEGIEIAASAGNVYISYRTASTDALSVAMSSAGGAWTHLGAQGFTGSISSGDPGNLAVDASGDVYIAYTVYPGYHANVQKYSGGSWSYVGYPNLTSALTNGGANSVRITLSGTTPYIAFDDRQTTYGVSVMKFVP